MKRLVSQLSSYRVTKDDSMNIIHTLHTHDMLVLVCMPNQNVNFITLFHNWMQVTASTGATTHQRERVSSRQ